MSKKKYMILGIVLGTLILGIGITYAWYVWQSSDDEVKTISATLGLARIVYEDGSDIEATIFPAPDMDYGVVKEFSIKSVEKAYYNLTFNLYLDAIQLDDVFKHESFKYTIFRNGEFLKEGNFTEEFKTCTLNNTSHLVLLEDEKITDTTTTYELVLWIDGLNYTNPIGMQDKLVKLKLHAAGTNASLLGHVATPTNAAQFITALYDGMEKIEVGNNDITYNYAPDVSLMDDGLGYGINVGNWVNYGGEYENSEACYDNFNCELHWSEWDYENIEACEADNLVILEEDHAGVSSVEELCAPLDRGNIRYYGPTPNNYIDIGDVLTEDTTMHGYETLGGGYADEEECRNDWYDGSTIEEWCEVYWEDDGFPSYEECVTTHTQWLYEDTGFTSLDEFCGLNTYKAGTVKSLYRIIGVFKDVELGDGTKQDLIKVVRERNIGYYSWDTSSSSVNDGNGVNEWSQADIMKMLNPGYENNTDEFCIYDEELDDYACSTSLVNNSLWWNSGEGNVYWEPYNRGGTSIFNFSGLTNNVHNRIESVVWNLGGHNANDIFPNQIYLRERSNSVNDSPADGRERSTTWTGRVALMYPSDIGYAVDFNICDVNWGDYNADCFESNYFKDLGDGYLLTPNYDSSFGVWGFDGGYVMSDWEVPWANPIVPTFYLKTDTMFTSGNGSRSNPYKVG